VQRLLFIELPAFVDELQVRISKGLHSRVGKGRHRQEEEQKAGSEAGTNHKIPFKEKSGKKFGRG
jgi:hypothetical protein